MTRVWMCLIKCLQLCRTFEHLHNKGLRGKSENKTVKGRALGRLRVVSSSPALGLELIYLHAHIKTFKNK